MTSGVWLIGLITQNSITYQRLTETETRVTDFEYYSTGKLKTKYNHKNKNLELKTEYTYDSFGNLDTTSFTARKDPNDASSVSTRTNINTYSTDGRFLTSATNSLGHKTIYTYNPTKGLLLTEKDNDNNLTTEYVYDDLGRLQRTIAPDDQETLVTLHWEENHTDAPDNAHTYSIKQAHAVPSLITFFDKYGRKLRDVSINFDGAKILIFYKIKI